MKTNINWQWGSKNIYMDVNIWYDYFGDSRYHVICMQGRNYPNLCLFTLIMILLNGENFNSDIRSMFYNLQKIIAIGFKVDNERGSLIQKMG